jgi:hypothetical protein
MNITGSAARQSFTSRLGVLSVLSVALACSLPGCPPAAHAEEQRVVDLVGQLGGEVGGVVVDGLHAYVGIGARLAVLSIGAGSDPYLVGTSDLLPGTVTDLAVVPGAVVTALGKEGVAVVDVRDPSRPMLAGRLQTDTTYHVEVSEGLAIVFAGTAVLTVDVSDPASPRVVAILQPFTLVGRSRFTLLSGDQLFVASDHDLVVLDVGDPRHLVVERWLESHEVWAIAASGTAVFAPVQTRDTPARGDCRMVLHALGGAGDNLLGELGAVELPNCLPMQAMIVSGQELFVRYRDGLQIVDVRDPTRPTLGPYVDLPLDGVMSTMTRPKQMALVGDRLLVTINTSGEQGPEPRPGGLAVVHLGDGASPTLGGGWYQDAPGVVTQSAIAGSSLVLLGGLGDVVRVYDVTIPDNPSLLSTFTPDSTPWDIAFAVPWLLTAEGYGLRVVDLSDPRRPVRAGGWDLLNDVRQVAISGRVVYAGVQHRSESGPEWREVLVFRRSPAGDLDLQRRVDVCESPLMEMLPVGDVLYLLCRDEGLLAVDIRNRDVPVPGASIAVGEKAKALAVTNGLALIATRQSVPAIGRLRVVDTTDRANLRATGVFTTELTFAGSAEQWGLAVAGHHVLMAAGERALRVVDVSDPYRPRQVQLVPVPSAISTLSRVGRYVYAAGEEGGLYVFRLVDETPPPARGQAFLPMALCSRRTAR